VIQNVPQSTSDGKSSPKDAQLSVERCFQSETETLHLKKKTLFRSCDEGSLLALHGARSGTPDTRDDARLADHDILLVFVLRFSLRDGIPGGRRGPFASARGVKPGRAR